MRHLVIGGAGFIGSNLAARLLSEAEGVVILDSFARRGSELNVEWVRASGPAAEIVRGDIRTDRELLAELVREADVIYHLAGQVAVTSSVADPRRDFEDNLLGTFN